MHVFVVIIIIVIIIIIIIIIITKAILLNGYLDDVYNCKSHLNKVIFNWLLKSLIIYTHN